MGVEEEFLLVDPLSRTPQSAAVGVIERATVEIGDQV
jgi:hypothetical protein